jgi:circadian clock protein KaiB
MTETRRHTETLEAGEATIRFVLFYAGDEPNSRLARANLSDLCATELAGRCEVREVDVLSDVDEAVAYSILVTPTLIVERPPPAQVLVGNLSDREKVRGVLGL